MSGGGGGMEGGRGAIVPKKEYGNQGGGGGGGNAMMEEEEDSPIRFFYEDAIQKLRFEEFVKGFLSMSVFHTAECWVARGEETLEQVCACERVFSLSFC